MNKCDSETIDRWVPIMDKAARMINQKYSDVSIGYANLIIRNSPLERRVAVDYIRSKTEDLPLQIRNLVWLSLHNCKAKADNEDLKLWMEKNV